MKLLNFAEILCTIYEISVWEKSFTFSFFTFTVFLEVLSMKADAINFC
jgi:hypothetical protein